MSTSTLTIVGLWLGIIGYGLIYAGAIKLSGGNCSIGDAFQNKCTPAGTKPASGGTGGASPRTLAQQKQELHNRQYNWLTSRSVMNQG